MLSTVRLARITDFESIYRLVCELESCQLNRKDFDRVFNKNLSDPNVIYLVADNEGEVIGFLSLHVQHILHHSRPTCELQELNIEPSCRDMGVGSLLLAEAERIASELGMEEIELTTKIFRERAQQFYIRTGYENTHLKFVKKLR